MMVVTATLNFAHGKINLIMRVYYLKISLVFCSRHYRLLFKCFKILLRMKTLKVL